MGGARKEKMQYEITFIVKEDGTNEEVLGVFAQNAIELKNLIDMGTKQFAFPIAKLNSGHYYTSEFDCETDKIIKIEKFLRLKKSLIRFLIIKKLRFPVKSARKPETKDAGVAKPTQSISAPAKIEEKPAKAEKAEEKTAPKEAKVATAKSKKAEEKVGTKEKAPAKTAKKAPVKKVSKVELDKQLEEMVKED
jgi:ribosomal protein S6